MGLESPNDMACGDDDSASCFPLDTGGVETCHSVRECGLGIRGSELSCNWGVLGKLANLSAAEVITCSADHSSLLTLVVSSSDSFSLLEASEPSVSDA
jgi:hypothetical protein